jgi:hypothetical protein
VKPKRTGVISTRTAASKPSRSLREGSLAGFKWTSAIRARTRLDHDGSSVPSAGPPRAMGYRDDKSSGVLETGTRIGKLRIISPSGFAHSTRSPGVLAPTTKKWGIESIHRREGAITLISDPGSSMHALIPPLIPRKQSIRVAPQLSMYGLSVTFERTRKGRFITLTSEAVPIIQSTRANPDPASSSADENSVDTPVDTRNSNAGNMILS